MRQHNNPAPVHLAIGGMLAMVAAMGIGRFVYTPILPMMIDQAGLNAAQAGMIASSNFLGYMLGAMIAATSMLKGSRRAWLLGALIASTLTTTLMAWTDSYLQYLVVRFVGGLVSSWVLVFASALVIDRLVAAGRGELTAVLFGGVGVGIVLASLLTSYAATSGGNWRTAWLYSGVLGLILVAIVAYLVPDKEPSTSPTKSVVNESGRSISGLLGAYALFGFGYVITATFIVQLVRSAQYSLTVETWVWVLVGISAGPSIWMWNKVAKELGNSKAFGIACVILALGVGASVLIVNLAGLVFAAIMLGGTFMGITALGLVEARARSTSDPRHTLAMMTAAFGLGQIIGPGVAGHMRDSSGSFLLPSLMASCALLLAAILVQIGGSKTS
jgi:predicted MFS family arabinose efflux permease